MDKNVLKYGHQLKILNIFCDNFRQFQRHHDIQHNDTGQKHSMSLCSVSHFLIVMLDVVILSDAFFIVMLNVVMLSVAFSYCYAECCYAESYYAESHYAGSRFK
jgi:hypothetical protein